VIAGIAPLSASLEISRPLTPARCDSPHGPCDNWGMPAATRSPVTLISIVVALLCAGWAIYVTKRSEPPSAMGPPAAGPGAGPGAPAGRGGPFGAGGSPVPVVSAAVGRQEISRHLRALGTARANESVEITSKLSNIVTGIRFRDGQKVARGDVLVELDSAQARADLAVANAALNESTSLYNRSKELMTTQALSKSQFEQIEATKLANEARVAAARAKLDDTFLRAPFSGRVGLRRVSVGTLINPGTIIATLDDASVIKVDFAVPENELASVRAGQTVAVQSAAFPGRKFAGKVSSIDSRIDPSTRAVSVRAELPNPELALKPGMFLTVDLTRDERSAVVIPEEALVPEQDKQFVFVAEDGKSVKREVQIGARRPGSVEILAGLDVGERVIVEGTVRVRDGGPIRDQAVVDAAVPERSAEART